MSYSIDVNILVYASNPASPKGPQAIQFLEERVKANELFCVAWITLMSYLRLVTSPAIRSPPLSAEEARQNIHQLLQLPHVRTLGELDGFWDVYQQVVRDRGIAGKLVPDAHLAAILKQHGIKTLYSADTDFRKFDFLDVRNPFQP